jgi:hypothetical protein
MVDPEQNEPEIGSVTSDALPAVFSDSGTAFIVNFVKKAPSLAETSEVKVVLRKSIAR